MERIDDIRMAAWRGFLEAQSRVLDALARELEEAHGLTLPMYEVLLYLYKEPGGSIRMRELAERVLQSKSGVTRLVDRMEREGLVARRACPSDGRGIETAITEHGRERFREAGPTHLRGIAEHFASHLSDAEARALARGLEKVNAALEPDRSLATEGRVPARAGRA